MNALCVFFNISIKGGITLETKDILPGDVLIVWGENLIDDAIEFVTHGPSHCALFLDPQTLAEAQGGRVSGTALLADYQSAKEKRLEVWRDETLSDSERKSIIDYAIQHFGIKYDYFAILVELARFEIGIHISDFDEGKRRICSTYVNDCSNAVNRNWANVPYAPAPVDLLKGGKLRQQGILSNGKSH